MIKKVLKYSKNDYKKILKIKENYNDAYKKKSEIINII
jgi:hypothetical protein